jgi:gp6-like head-tail connector protein
MNFVLERVTQPDIEPVTLEEMRMHLRVFGTDEDAMILGLIVSAREWVEDETGRALIDQSWRLTLSEDPWVYPNVVSDAVRGPNTGICYPLPDGGILLRKSPVIAITSVATVDSVGVETAVGAATYQVREADSKWPRLYRINGSWSGTMRIVFRAGFAERLGSPVEGVQMVPERFKQAIKLWVEAHFDRDEKMMPLLLDVAAQLVRPERSELQLA